MARIDVNKVLAGIRIATNMFVELNTQRVIRVKETPVIEMGVMLGLAVAEAIKMQIEAERADEAADATPTSPQE